MAPDYKRVQFIAFNIKPGAKTDKTTGDEVYRGHEDNTADVRKRCTIMKTAISTAYSQKKTDKAIKVAKGPLVNPLNKDRVLTVFMAPEFYFRGAQGAYPIETVSEIMQQLRAETDNPRYKDWLFIFGTAIGYLKHDDTITKILETGSEGGNSLITVETVSRPIEIGAWIEQKEGAVKGKVTQAQEITYDEAGAAKKGYKLTLAGNPQFTPGKLVTVKMPGGATEVFNIALVRKGGPDPTPKAGEAPRLTDPDRELLVYKEYVSHIDYLRDLNLPWTQRRIQIHGDDARRVLPTEGSQDSFASQTNRPGDKHAGESVSEESKSGLGGGSIFTIDGITFGLEVCLDHYSERLDKYYKTPEMAGKPKPQIHLIPSWGMTIGEGPICCRDNGLIFNVDGARGDSIVRLNDEKVSCDYHPQQTGTAGDPCPQCTYYSCTVCHLAYPGNHKLAGNKCPLCNTDLTLNENKLQPLGTAVDPMDEPKTVTLGGFKWFSVTQTNYFMEKGSIVVYPPKDIPGA